MGHSISAAHDPSVAVRRRHLPGFAREELRGQTVIITLPTWSARSSSAWAPAASSSGKVL